MSGSSRYEIDIIANNKASAALGKTNAQLKKINGSSAKVNSSFGKMAGLAGSVIAAFAGFKLGGAFLDTAKQMENLNIQLKFIAGSAELGAKALDIVEVAAGKSAFALEDMAKAAPLLLTVGTVDELNDNLGITADIAAATGLEFDVVAGQIQRAFSGGIASADIFREKGVKSMLGFQEGVKYTAEQTEKMIKDAFKNSSTSLAGAAAEMAKTWDGQISMMGDAWFKFKKSVMGGGLFASMKRALTAIQGVINRNKEAIAAFALSMSQGLAKAVDKATEAFIFFGTHFDFFMDAVKVFIGLKLAMHINKIIPAMKALGVVMRANPIGLLITGVAALIAYLSFQNGLGRTIVQIQAAFTQFGKMLGRFTAFLNDKVAEVIIFVKKKFSEFTETMIKAYNAVVEFIPGLKVIETAAAGAVGSLSDLGKQGFEYVSEKVEIFKDNLIGMIPPVLIGEIRNLQDEITMAGLTYDRAEKQAKALSQTVGYQDRIMRLAAVATAELAAKQTLLRKAIAAAAIEVNAFTDFWTDLKAELFPTEIAITLIKEQIDKLKIAIAGGHMEADKMIESVKLLEAQLTKLTTAGGESTKKIEDQAQAFKDKLQQMQDSYFPLEAATRRYKEEVLFLNEALDEGLISEERHAESLKKAKEGFDKLAESFKVNVKVMLTESEKFVKKFNEDFNDKLADGLVEGNLGFDTFADMWKSTLKDLIKDTLNGGTLLNDILSSFGSGKKGGLGGLFSGIGSLFGGGGGGTGGFDLGGTISGITSGIGDFFGGFFADGGKLGAGKFGVAGEAGAELITGPANITPIDDIQNDTPMPAVNITIQAIDTQTGTEFLLKNKKQITGIIQGAYNKRGKQGIY